MERPQIKTVRCVAWGNKISHFWHVCIDTGGESPAFCGPIKTLYNLINDDFLKPAISSEYIHLLKNSEMAFFRPCCA